jgi:hypothetical protein
MDFKKLLVANIITDILTVSQRVGDGSITNTLLGHASQISRAGSLVVNTTRSLNMKAGKIYSIEDLEVAVGGDINVISRQIRTIINSDDGNDKYEKVTNVGSVIMSANGVASLLGTNINLENTFLRTILLQNLLWNS